MMYKRFSRFILPDFTSMLTFRMILVVVVAYVLFGQLLIPLRIQGRSMEPTYRDGSFNFCWRLTYFFKEYERKDIVTIRFAGRRVMLLKRIVALAGETVGFRQGVLVINGEEIKESYVNYPSNWTLAPRIVQQGKVYVVGDNRSVPIQQHNFGQVSQKRIVGGVVF